MDEWPGNHGRHDVVLEHANEPAGLSTALALLRAGGLCTSTSIHFAGSVEIPILQMYMTSATLTTGRTPAGCCSSPCWR